MAAATAAYAPKAAIAARAFQPAAQSLPNGVATALSFTGENFDSDAIHDNTTNPSRFTCPAGKGGTYVVVGAVGFAANATGTRSARIHLTRAAGGGGLRCATAIGADTTAGNPTRVPVGDVVDLLPGDYIEMFALSFLATCSTQNRR